MYYDDFILYDWFSFTSKVDSVDSVLQLLGFDVPFKCVKGARGYLHREYFEGVSIHHGGRDEIWVEMSGQGCRAFETYGNGAWDTLFEIVQGTGYNVTRLDVAFDDHTGIFNLERLFHDTDAQYYVSRSRSWEIRKSNKGITIYHGSEQSDIRFRIYDKAKERNREEEGHWIRFEIQLRDDRADMFLGLLTLRTVGDVFISVVNNYLRYVTPPENNDSRVRRWPTADYWERFIGVAGKQSLYIAPGTEYNIMKLERFVVDQAGAAAAAYIEIEGVDAYLDKVSEKLAESLNPKYQDLIDRHRIGVYD